MDCCVTLNSPLILTLWDFCHNLRNTEVGLVKWVDLDEMCTIQEELISIISVQNRHKTLISLSSQSWQKESVTPSSHQFIRYCRAALPSCNLSKQFNVTYSINIYWARARERWSFYFGTQTRRPLVVTEIPEHIK